MTTPEKAMNPQMFFDLFGVKFTRKELEVYFSDEQAVDNDMLDELIETAKKAFAVAMEEQRQRIIEELKEIGITISEDDLESSTVDSGVNLLTEMASQGVGDIEFFKKLVLPENTGSLAEYTAQLMRCTRTAAWEE